MPLHTANIWLVMLVETEEGTEEGIFGLWSAVLMVKSNKQSKVLSMLNTLVLIFTKDLVLVRFYILRQDFCFNQTLYAFLFCMF